MNTILPSYIIDTSLFSPLGLTTQQNFEAVLNEETGIRTVDDSTFFPRPVLTSVMSIELMEQYKNQFNTQTRFDSLLLACVNDMKQKNRIDYSSADTGIILSTTKGNIELLEKPDEDNNVLLTSSASLIAAFLLNPNKVMIVSNACISGISACIMAQRLLHTGAYRHILVVGCDVVTRFVLSGFSSFRAVSKLGCKPFDLRRDGIVLGEACGAILFGKEKECNIAVSGGFISNDANHISGPSKTGEELAWCIEQTLLQNNLKSDEIDFVAAHGTATIYNDEMESKAIDAAGLNQTPVFSFKAHFGHTLGASGVIETILTAECLQQNKIPASMGFEQMGVSGNINVNTGLIEKPLHYAMKTTSGFGGCNAAMLMEKVY